MHNSIESTSSATGFTRDDEFDLLCDDLSTALPLQAPLPLGARLLLKSFYIENAKWYYGDVEIAEREMLELFVNAIM